MTELRQCPFCGGAPKQIVSDGYNDEWVVCNKCGAEGPTADVHEDASEMWNTRVSDGLVTELVEALDTILQHHITTIRLEDVRKASAALACAREAGYGKDDG